MPRTIELREGASNAEPLGISRVNAGNEGTHQAIEQLWREFSANESGDGFVGIGRNAFSEDVAGESPFRRSIDQ